MKSLRYPILFILFPAGIFWQSQSCDQQKSAIKCDYGTQSDSARIYFLLGWEQILDNGEWTLAEQSFRKAVEYDPDFLIGQSLVHVLLNI